MQFIILSGYGNYKKLKTMETNTLNITDIYNKFYKQVKYYIQKHTFNIDIAEDITSEVFIKINKNLKKFDPKISSINTWVFMITKRMCIDYIRSKKSNEDIEDIKYQLISPYCTENIVNNNELYGIIMSEIDKLPTNYKQIFKLKYLDDLSYNEIGDKLDLNEGQIKMLLFRSREKITKKLQPIKNLYLC